MGEIDGVVRWERVGQRWLGHRPEPFIAERLWACPLVPDAPPGGGWRFEAGFDRQGRAIARRVTAPGAGGDESSFTEVAVRRARSIEMALEYGDTTLRAELDPAGHPVRTVYHGEIEGEEVYRYEHGRLVGIEELDGLWDTAIDSARNETGGSLSVEYDERGPVRIAGAFAIVWERSDEPWPAVLAAGAATIRDGVIATTRSAVRGAEIDPATEVFSLMLVYVAGSGLHALICFGLESERRRWLAAGLDGHELACRLWEPEPEHGAHPLYLLDESMLDEDEGRSLYRAAAMQQAGDPQRTVLNAAARLLALHDWSGVLTPTPDFVVYIAEHDEGFAPKAASVRAVNPPERVAAWDASWPQFASRGEDEGR